MMTGAKSNQGFSVVELIISAFIIGLLLTLLGSLFATSTRAYVVNEEVSEEQQQQELAAQLLMYEIGLAGYKGTDREDHYNTAPTGTTVRSFSDEVLTVTSNTDPASPALPIPDEIEVRFFEDREVVQNDLNTSSDSNEIRVAYKIATHNGEPHLFREEEKAGSVSNDPLIPGVTNLEVTGFVWEGLEAPIGTRRSSGFILLENVTDPTLAEPPDHFCGSAVNTYPCVVYHLTNVIVELTFDFDDTKVREVAIPLTNDPNYERGETGFVAELIVNP